jgi:hypothetical protein
MTKYNYNRQYLDVTIVTALFVLSFPIAQTYPMYVYIPVLTGVFMFRHFIVSRINKRDYLKAWDEQNDMLKKSKAQWKKSNLETLEQVEGYLKDTNKQFDSVQRYWLSVVKGLNESGLLKNDIVIAKDSIPIDEVSGKEWEEWHEDLIDTGALLDDIGLSTKREPEDEY